MIYILASLYLSVFLRQSATSPPQAIDWAQLLLTSGVVVAIVGIVGNLVLAQQKRINDEHLGKMNEAIENSKAERQQDFVVSESLSQTVTVLKTLVDNQTRMTHTAEQRNATQARQADLAAIQNEYLDQLTEKVRAMMTDLSSGRAEIISKVTEKIGDADTKAVERHTEDAQLFNAVRADVAAVKTDLDEKTAEILRRFDEAPTVKGHQEIARQITGMLDEIKARLAAIEARLPAAEPPKADGAALAGDGVPVIPPTESKPPEVTQ